jgi:hypothetical protein
MSSAAVKMGALLPTPVFESRWGFHPVSREVDKKLRFLNGIYQRALRMAASWRRWDRKDPSNRVHRPRIRSNGQVIGYGQPEPWNEPAICPIFSNKTTRKVEWHPMKGYFKGGIDFTSVETDGPYILSAAKQARTHCKTAAEVRPLPLTVEEINTLYDRAMLWLASK